MIPIYFNTKRRQLDEKIDAAIAPVRFEEILCNQLRDVYRLSDFNEAAPSKNTSGKTTLNFTKLFYLDTIERPHFDSPSSADSVMHGD